MHWVQRLAFVFAVLFGLWTLFLSLAMSGLVPDPPTALARDYETPILLLEFAASESDVEFLRGEAGAVLRESLQRVQSLDFWFPIAYAGMTFWCFLGLGMSGERWAWSGAFLSLATIPADWSENAVINTMLMRLEGSAAVLDLLPDLALATWVKWLLIAAFALVFAIVMLREKRRVVSITGIVAALIIILTAASQGNALFAELIMLPLALFFLTILLVSMIYLRASFKAETMSHESPRKNES